jgi:two-component system, cell cycle sensor histidine kinase and response regulator CckA
VIVNLAVNARDAMPRGGQLTIETMNADVAPRDSTRYPAVMAPAKYVLLAVSDSGHGMDAETKARIFEPFFTTKPAGRGTGLGLSMVYGIVKQSGGWIWVYSEPGQGTVFKIYFPPAPGSAARLESGDGSSSRSEHVGRGVVLVVEDEADVRGLTVKMLSRAGYTVLEAASGEEALVVSAGHVGPIDLLVADVVLPGLSGRDTATRLVASRPDLRTLYTSGYTDAVIAERGVLTPESAFLAKPFTADSLLAAVEQVMDE